MRLKDAHRRPRRQLLLALAGLGASAGLRQTHAANPAGPVEAVIREGRVVVAFRHANAPGTFDPPGMRLDDCRTQRNLDEGGRAQAQRIGEWFSVRGLKPTRVRSSPWCRCIDTATLAFGAPQVWAALGSPHGRPATETEPLMRALRQAVVEASKQPGRFETWVTHMFVLSALTGESTSSGEALLLRATADGTIKVLGRLAP